MPQLREQQPKSRMQHPRTRAARLIFEQIPIGNKRNCAYLVGDRNSGEAVVVDAGFQPDLLLDRLRDHGVKLKCILATHSHRDHIGAAFALKKATGALLAAYKTIPEIDRALDDGDEVVAGNIRIEMIHTPGHTADSACFLVDGHKLIAGDTLFVGRAPKAPSALLAKQFFESLHGCLLQLGDDVEVWPGHDVGPTSSSTIGRERSHNNVLQMDFDDFCRRTWDREQKQWIVP